MENKQKKCIKGKSCLYCGTTYCQFVDELNELNSFKEQIKFQNNFIDSLLKATNNSEWLDKSILDDETSEIIEKIELDYSELDRLKAENEELKEEIAKARMEICNQCGEKDDYNIPCKQIRDLDYGLQLEIEENDKLKQTLTEIKEIAEKQYHTKLAEKDCINCDESFAQILQKISEVIPDEKA